MARGYALHFLASVLTVRNAHERSQDRRLNVHARTLHTHTNTQTHTHTHSHKCTACTRTHTRSTHPYTHTHHKQQHTQTHKRTNMHARTRTNTHTFKHAHRQAPPSYRAVGWHPPISTVSHKSLVLCVYWTCAKCTWAPIVNMCVCVCVCVCACV